MNGLLPGNWHEETQTYLKHISAFPSLHRSLLPTPFHRLPRLGKKLGIDLWCKRDDLTGFGFGGNKTRKLDFLVAQARREGATTLIGIGAVQSNFCRMTAAYASAEGMECFLVLGGTHQQRGTGNHLLSERFGAECVYVQSDTWDDWTATAQQLSRELSRQGRVPFLMPIGGSTPVGALGYVQGMMELMEQAVQAQAVPERIYFATSSGGTHAGLAVGKAAMGWNGVLQGIAVAKSAAQLQGESAVLARQCGALTGVNVPANSVTVNDMHIGEGYAWESGEAKEAQELFARYEGIVLDSVYTGKAAAGLIADARSGVIAPGTLVTFIHTGGSPEVFE